MRVLRLFVLVAMVCVLPACSSQRAIRVGAVYPTGGGQGPGGTEEYRGLQLAAAYSRLHGGADVRLEFRQADSYDAAARAVADLAEDGVKVIAGSYGSTISKPAAAEASRRGLVFWETGAVGMLDEYPDGRVFRFPPTGQMLGRAAVRFVEDDLGPKIGRDDLRYAVTYVDDVYGRSVGLGAVAELHARNMTPVATLPYELSSANYDELARQVAASGANVLVVSSYLDDAVAMRRALIAHQVKLVAGIGTSSSYCHLAFGRQLGGDAVGLFASDKPDGDVLDPSTLHPDAAAALRWARDTYKRRYTEAMPAAALSGFAAGWALFRHVLPKAGSDDPAKVAAAARSIRLDQSSLPNGAGLHFTKQGDNRLAASVIWEWVRPAERAIVWPPAFATEPLQPLPLS